MKSEIKWIGACKVNVKLPMFMQKHLLFIIGHQLSKMFIQIKYSIEKKKNEPILKQFVLYNF